jgi:putative ABC transport system permease protein
MLARLRSTLKSLVRRSRFERDMTEELRTHLRHRAEDLFRAGLTQAEAERQARLEFGALEAWKEECREARGLRLLDELSSDLRLAARSLRKSRGFTASAVLSLALGIGANTAIYSVVHAALLRPLPYRDPDRLVAVFENHVTRGSPRNNLAVANFVDLQAGAGSLQELAGYTPTGRTLTGLETPEQVSGGMVTSNAFTMLGAPALLGRTLLPEDGDPASPAVVLLSHEFWTRTLGGDLGVLGRSLLLDGRGFEVVGIMPASFRFPLAFHEDRYWIPLQWDARAREERSNHDLWCVGRLRDGSAPGHAQAEASAVFSRLRADHPETNAGIDSTVLPLREAISGDARRPLLVLLAAVGLMLLIACANVANLVLARSTARQTEIAVRAALGASGLRIVRHLLTETLLLALLGGIAAALLCAWAVPLLGRLLPPELLPAGAITLNDGVLLFGLGAALVTGLACGLAPAVALSCGAARRPLTESSRSTSGAAGGFQARGVLVASETALTLVLLVALGLLLRSFRLLLEVDPGVRSGGVVAVRFVLPPFLYLEHSQRVAFYDQLLERTQALPGVDAAGLITTLPFLAEGESSWFIMEEATSFRPQELLASNRLVSPDYFRAMGIPLRRGRFLGPHDSADAPLVAVINEAMARRFWPDADPIGKRFHFYDKPSLEIVGVVGDVRQRGPEQKAQPEIYRPFVQDTQVWLAPHAFVARTSLPPRALGATVRDVIHGLGRNVPVPAVETLEDLLGETVGPRRASLQLVGLFAGVAALLTTVGIYGVVAYAAARRTRELAVRAAIGAQRRQLLLLLLGKGLVPAALGVGMGLALSLGFTRFVASLLFGVSATDVPTLVGVALSMTAIAAAASLVPAWRGSRVNPPEALRYE